MGRPGPKRSVSDNRLLTEIFIHENNSLFASQVKENVDLSTVQGVRDRLNNIVENTDRLEKDTVSGRNLYRLTDEGTLYVRDLIRSSID
jgi:predicted transcriptional regulator